ncbi:MAG: hypothetical protein RIA69_17315 [Cyclobacteriaceae bacterium]
MAILKIVSGLLVAYVFVTYQEGSDTKFLYEQSVIVAEKAKLGWSEYFGFLSDTQFPSFKSESRNLFFGKIVSILGLLTNNHFWLITIYLALGNFLCGFYLFQSIINQFNQFKPSAFIALFLLPSSLAWTSGIFKETLLTSFIFIILICLLNFPSSKRKVVLVSITLVLCYFIFNIKYYVLPPLIMALTVLLTGEVQKVWKLSPKAATISGLIFVGVIILIASTLQHHLSLSRIPESLFDNFDAISARSSSQNIFSLNFDASWWSILYHSPLSIFTGLFRPMPFEGSTMNVLYWLESLIAIIFTIYSLVNLKRWKPSYLMFSLAVFIITLALFLPMSTGNFGTLARYRVVYWPFFIFLISIIPLKDIVSFRQRIG